MWLVIEFNVWGSLLHHPLLQPVFANLKLSIKLSGVVSLFCFYMSAKTKNEYDILKCGDGYREYMRSVPMRNIVRE